MVFHGGCLLRSQQQCGKKDPTSPRPFPPWLWSVFCFLNDSHPCGCTVVSHCGLDLHFPDE